MEAFHVVVVAHSLEGSKLHFEGCCEGAGVCREGSSGEGLLVGGALSGAAEPRRCVSHFVRGTLNLPSISGSAPEAEASVSLASSGSLAAGGAASPALVSPEGLSSWMGAPGGSLPPPRKPLDEDDRLAVAPSFVPAHVLTTAQTPTSPSAPFFSISLCFPVDIVSSAAARAVAASAARGEPQVYEIVGPRRLSDRELGDWLLRCRRSPHRVFEWQACPQYSAPQSFRPFVLDQGGLFYVNAIDNVACLPEMSLIGARNVVNLIADWVALRRGQGGF